jgi:hypothetical protein
MKLDSGEILAAELDPGKLSAIKLDSGELLVVAYLHAYLRAYGKGIRSQHSFWFYSRSNRFKANKISVFKMSRWVTKKTPFQSHVFLLVSALLIENIAAIFLRGHHKAFSTYQRQG